MRRIAAILVFPLAVFAAESLVHQRPGRHDLMVDNPRFVIEHAEVLGLSEPATSFGRPAEGRLRILTVLRGRQPAPREVRARFAPPLMHDDMVDPRQGNYELKDEAKGRLYDLPRVGSHVLIAYCCVDGGTGDIAATQGYLVDWSAENEAEVRRTAVPAGGSPLRQGVLMLAMAVLLAAGVGLTADGGGRPVAGLFCFLASAAAGAWYGAGVSKYTEIRIDLLILIPLLALSAAGVFWAGLRAYRQFAGSSV